MIEYFGTSLGWGIMKPLKMTFIISMFRITDNPRNTNK